MNMATPPRARLFFPFGPCPVLSPIGQVIGDESPWGEYFSKLQGTPVQVRLYTHINFIIG